MSETNASIKVKRALRLHHWFSGRWRKGLAPLSVGLIGLALLFLNWGLYRRLNPPEPFTAYTLPYSQNFDDIAIDGWFSQGGQWVIRDEALLQAADGVDLGQIFIPHWLEEGQTYRLTTQIEPSDSTQAVGISFNAQYPQIYSLQHRVFVARNGDRFEVVAGYTDEVEGFIPQVTVPLSQPSQTFRLDLLVDEHVYHVRVDGQTVVYKRPLFYHGGLVGFYAVDGPSTFDNLSLVAVEKISVEPIPTPTAAANDEARAVAEERPAEIKLPVASTPLSASHASDGYENLGANGLVAFDGHWIPFSGDWQAEDGSLSQLNPNGYDLGIGYEDGVFQSFALEVSLAHLEGRGGGLLFNMPTPYQLNGAHMVRYSDRADAIFWGYYDDDLKFVGQGYARLNAPPGQTGHTFKIISADTTYDIYLDGQLMAGDVPLNRREGYIGLITSQSKVAYSRVEVSKVDGVAEEVALAPTPTLEIESSPTPKVVKAVSTLPGQVWQPALPDDNQNWTADGTTIRQNSPEATDYMLNTDVFAKAYTLETGITLPDDPELSDAGGGIIFHMPERNRKSQAHMARLTDGGTGVFWGYYDDNGKFIGQGWAELTGEANTYDFKVIVQQNSYTLVINGETIAAGIPLTRQEGWLGLLAYSGPVTFRDVRITLSGNE